MGGARLASVALLALVAMAAPPSRAQSEGIVRPAPDTEADPTRSHACDTIGRVTVVAEASIEPDPVDVLLRIRTSSGERVLRVGAARRARHQAGLDVIDSVRVAVAGIEGPTDVAVVTVATFVAGEDDGWHDDTFVVVALRGRPRVLWLGPGDYERGRMGVCTMTRSTAITVVGDTLRVRSRVDASLAADGDAALRARLAPECVAPRATRADVPLR